MEKRNGKSRFLALALALTLAAGVCTAAGTENAGEPAPAGSAAAQPAEAGADTAEEAGAAEEAPEPDAPGTLSFANIGPRMRESYAPMRALQEFIDDIESHDYEWARENKRNTLNAVATASYYAALTGSTAMQSYYEAALTAFSDIANGKTQKEDKASLRQYENAQNLTIVAGESLFMTLKDLEAQDAALTRTLGQLDRTVTETRLRAELGQVSPLLLSQAENGRAQAVSGQETLRMNIEVILLNLKSMVGAELGEALALGELPKVTREQLDAMDLEADFARAKELSYDLFATEKDIHDFRAGTYIDTLQSVADISFEATKVKHTLRSMELQQENELQTFEINFRTLYAQVKDCAQVLEAKKTALAAQEKSYAASALKFSQGSISENKLADAKDELAQARDDVADAERSLFNKYRAYQWAVQYGILNSTSQGGSTNAS